jgi:hypothetical protein
VEETLATMETLDKAAFYIFCGVRILPHTRLYEVACQEGQVRPGEDLLTPRFYQAPGIGSQEIRERIEARARGRINWVYGDGGDGLERVLARMYRRGHSGPLWELLLR